MKNYIRFKREKALKLSAFFTNSVSKLSKIAMLASCFWTTNTVAQTQKAEPIANVNNRGKSLESDKRNYSLQQRGMEQKS